MTKHINMKTIAAALAIQILAVGSLAAQTVTLTGLPDGHTDTIAIQLAQQAGAVHGAPGTGVGWGFTVVWTSNVGDRISFTSSSLGSLDAPRAATLLAPVGYFDYIGLQGGPDNFYMNPGTWTQNFVEAHSGVGVFPIAADAVLNGQDASQITFTFQVFDSAGVAIGDGSYSYSGASTAYTVTVDNPFTGEGPPPVVTVGPSLAVEATGPLGANVSYDVSTLNLLQPACSPLSGSTFPIGVTTVTCSSRDQAGQTGSASFTITVRDTTPPVLTLPQPITAAAPSAAGVAVTFAATSMDVVDGARMVACAPASGSTFAAGTTTVNCTATDNHGNTGTGSFAVVITAPANVTTPGRMRGDGFVRDDDAKYKFEFDAREDAVGNERARIALKIDDDGRNPKGKKDKKARDDKFTSRTVSAIAFSDDPTIRPGKPRLAQVDTVLFSGVGEWNGQTGYRYEVFAQDAGEPGRHRESIRMTVWSPSGAIVATFEGDLDGGNVQSTRIRH